MSLRIAVIGAGPAGLALALHAARLLPHAEITVYDARPAERDISADPRTLALSLGSVQWLMQLGAWPAAAAEPILEVHVSQAPPSLGQAQVRITAVDTANNTVSFVGPSRVERTVAVRAPELREFLKTLKVGDRVDVAIAEAVAVRVEPPER